MAGNLQGIPVQADVAAAARPAHGRAFRGAAIAGLAAVGLLLAGGGVLLWMRHGVAIFFDTVAAGLATCF